VKRYFVIFFIFISFSKLFCLEEILPEQPKPETDLSLSSSIFFKVHKEDNFKYIVSGLGIYYLIRHLNLINYKLSSFLSVSKDILYWDNELEIIAFQHLKDKFYIYPTIATKFVSLYFNHFYNFKVHDLKAILYTGVGCGLEKERFAFFFQIDFFKDVFNKVIVSYEKSKPSKRFYSNPFGFRLKQGLNFRFSKIGWLGSEVFYAQTNHNVYSDKGMQLHLNWSF
jgi:hypothetical protein